MSDCAPAFLNLTGRLTTRTSDETRQSMLSVLETASGNLVLDCSEVTEVDVSFLQLLVATQRSAEPLNKTVAFLAPPQGVLADALRRCGFAAPETVVSLAEIVRN
jgi:anti-anti-sigma regulatory factor